MKHRLPTEERDKRPRGNRGWLALAGVAALLAGFAGESRGEEKGANSPASAFRLPTVPAEHRHVRELLENALRYVAPENRIVDPVSGYPFEGWNQDPKRGLFLRSFTQLTAIGQWMELLANVAAGEVGVPFLSQEDAFEKLAHLVRTLRQDQHDPTLGARGLLGNFLDLATGKRLGPLASDVDKAKILEAFGPEKGEALWKALRDKGWIVSRNNDREAAIQRIAGYGYEHFDGPLAPFNDEATKQKLLAILDQRVVMVVFGDNANLSASAAKTIGALLAPSVKGRPEAVEIRKMLEQFLDDQKEGYFRLYDAEAGLFDFGWDATRDRLFGWEDLQGKWTTGHMDYLVNEFRAPAMFVVLKYGLPLDAISDLGFKIKPYTTRDGRDLYALAPWEGSAFQALGLGLWLGELDLPSWRTLLGAVVAIEVDYATRHNLPGFLSESYTGVDTQYTGSVGIPELAVSPRPRITDAASLYTLGTAYAVDPEAIERFLAANWPIISTLLTDHGPWEGYNTTLRQVIPFQTTAHTLALVLGFLHTGGGHMDRYLASQGLAPRRDALFPAGGARDLMAGGSRVVAWTDKEGTLTSGREPGGGGFRVASDRFHFLGIALIADEPDGADLSGGLLRLRYRSSGPLSPVAIELKPPANPRNAALIPREILTRLDATGGREAEVRVPLPAVPGLERVKEVVLTYQPKVLTRPVDLTITHADVAPVAGRTSP